MMSVCFFGDLQRKSGVFAEETDYPQVDVIFLLGCFKKEVHVLFQHFVYHSKKETRTNTKIICEN